MDSFDTSELDASFDEANARSSVSSGFLSSVNTGSDMSTLQLDPSIKSHKLLCQARCCGLGGLGQAGVPDLGIVCNFDMCPLA